MSADAPVPVTVRKRRWWRLALVAVSALGVSVLLAVAWLVATPGGAQLVFDRVAVMMGKGVKVTGVEGSLLGTLRIRSIEVVRPDLVILIRDLVIERSPDAPWFGRAVFRRVEAQFVEVRTASSEAAARVPLAFPAPYPLRVELARVGELHLGTLPKSGHPPPATVLKDLALTGEGDERSWKVDQAAVETPWGRVTLAGTLATARPFALDARGEFTGARDELRYRIAARFGGTLQRIDATFDAEERDLRARGTAQLEPFEKQPVRALTLNARDVDLGRYTGGAHTRLAIEAALRPAAQGFAGTVKIDNAEPGPLDRGRFPVVSIEGHAAWVPQAGAGNVEIGDARVVLSGGGTAQGSGRWRQGRLEAQAKVSGVDAAQWHTRLRPTKLGGTLSAVSEADGQRFEVALVDPRFTVEGAATLKSARLDVQALRVKHGGGVVEGKGFLVLAQRRDFRFEGSARHFDPSAFVKDAPGDINLELVASGALEPLAGEVRVEFAPSRLVDLPLGGAVRVAGDARRIASADVNLSLGDARIQAKGAFGRVDDVMNVAIQAPSLGALAKPLGIAASGKLEARATLTGTFAAPGGRFELSGGNLALPGGFYVTSIVTRGEASTEASGKVDATLEARNVTQRAGDKVNVLAERVTATLQGTRAAHRASLVAAVAKDEELSVAIEGGLDPKAARPLWQGNVATLSLTGPSAFQLASPAPLVAAADRVELGEAIVKGTWGEARLATTRWTPALLEARGSTTGILVRNAARALRLATVPRGNLVIAGEWDVRAAESVDGFISISRAQGDARIGDPPQPLGLEDLNLRIEARRGQAKATMSVRGQRVGSLEGEVSATLVRRGAGIAIAADAPIQGQVDAKMDSIAWVAAWLGPEARADGRVNARLAISGTMASPRFAGRVDAENVSLREPQSGFEVEKGVVALALTDRSIVVEKLSASTPWHPPEPALEALKGYSRPAEGTLSATGSLDLGSRTGAIVIKATAVPVTQLSTRFLALSGEAKVEARSDALVANGTLRADAGWIGALATALPSVSEDVVVVRSLGTEDRRARERLRMDLRFSLGDNLWYRGRGLETKLAGDLRILGEPGTGLRATGAIRTVSGTYDAYGRKLTIEHGTLTFFGSVENPTLDVRALRKGLPVEAGVEVTGNVARPRVRLVAQPDVPDPEKISWLVLGRAPGDVSQGEAAMLVSAANSLIGRTAGVGDITKRFGFDEVKVGRADAISALGVLPQSTVAGKTGTAAAGDVVSIGKRLTNDIYVVYEHGLADAEGALRVTWQLTQAFQMLLRAGYQPGVDAVYRWTFE